MTPPLQHHHCRFRSFFQLHFLPRFRPEGSPPPTRTKAASESPPAIGSARAESRKKKSTQPQRRHFRGRNQASPCSRRRERRGRVMPAARRPAPDPPRPSGVARPQRRRARGSRRRGRPRGRIVGPSPHGSAPPAPGTARPASTPPPPWSSRIPSPATEGLNRFPATRHRTQTWTNAVDHETLNPGRSFPGRLFVSVPESSRLQIQSNVHFVTVELRDNVFIRGEGAGGASGPVIRNGNRIGIGIGNGDGGGKVTVMIVKRVTDRRARRGDAEGANGGHKVIRTDANPCDFFSDTYGLTRVYD